MLRWPGRSLPSQRPDESSGGVEAMKKLNDVWLIGSKLAEHLQVKKTNLYRAAGSGELRTSSTACGRLATTIQEAERWLRQSRA